jgi:serine protease Do
MPHVPSALSVEGACAFLALLLPTAGAQDPESYDIALQRRITPEVRVVREVAPAVVSIEATQAPYFAGFDLRTGQPIKNQMVTRGTGVVVDADGFIVTNFHVVANAQSIKVQFDKATDPTEYLAELVSYVDREDLALLKINGARKFPVVTMGSSSDLMIGERVIAIGNPYHQQLSASSGMISGLHREKSVENIGLAFTDLIQTDASINPGNSGGPLLNVNGEMIGLNTLVQTEAENMGFAIPVDRVREVLADQLFAPAWDRTWLGFELGAPSPLTVSRIFASGPADEAGLEVGDSLIALEGQALVDAKDFGKRKLVLVPNQPVKVRVRRQGAERDLILRGWKKADGILFQRLGLTVQAIQVYPYQLLRVDKVLAGGPAAALGLTSRDVIDAVQVEGSDQAWTLHLPESFARLVADLKTGTVLEIDVLRDENKNGRLEREELLKGKLAVL